MRRPKPLAVPLPLMNVVASAILVLAMLVLLVACGTATPTVDVQVQCPPIDVYSRADQDAIRAAYDDPCRNPVLRRTIMDYRALRDASAPAEARTEAPLFRTALFVRHDAASEDADKTSHNCLKCGTEHGEYFLVIDGGAEERRRAGQVITEIITPASVHVTIR